MLSRALACFHRFLLGRAAWGVVKYRYKSSTWNEWSRDGQGIWGALFRKGAVYNELAVMVRALLFLLLFPLSALAQSYVPADVENVVSGGYWENGGESGRYRVVVLNSGFEHVTSRVVVEWLREPRAPNAVADVVASVEPKLPFGNAIASLGATLTPVGKGKVRIVVRGVVSAEPARKVRAVLIATQPGRVAALTANRSIDTDVLAAGFARLWPAGHFRLQGLPRLSSR
jgi:hypothetical protein